MTRTPGKNALFGLDGFPARLQYCIDKVERMEAFPLTAGAGVDAGSMSKYLKGILVPGLDRMVRIAETAKVRPAWLVFGEGDPEPKPDTCFHLDRAAYVAVPTLQSSGEINAEKYWGFFSREELTNCIAGFPKMKLAFFRVTEGARGPKFFFGKWLLVDLSPVERIETGDYCLRSKAGIFARQVTLLDDGRLIVLSPGNGITVVPEKLSLATFNDQYKVEGRIVVGFRWSVFEGPPQSTFSVSAEGVSA